MAPEDKDKKTFRTIWGAFASNVMKFGLKNAPLIFQKWIQEVSKPFLTLFMRVFLDEFSVFGKIEDHLYHLKIDFEKIKMARLALNPAKCAFGVSKGILLGQFISKDDMQIDDRKILAIKDAPIPKTLRQVAKFVGQVKWHNRYLRCLSHVCQPLSKMTKKKAIFEWGPE